jgi:hypothetical protein
MCLGQCKVPTAALVSLGGSATVARDCTADFRDRARIIIDRATYNTSSATLGAVTEENRTACPAEEGEGAIITP